MTLSQTFLQACRREPVPYVPVWYMRQAGRYQPEYREIRRTYSLLEICRRPEVCAQVTTLPVDQLGVDAAILFSDIMVPIGAMGLDFEIRENVGPVIESPVRSQSDIDLLHGFDPEESLPYVMDSIRLLVKDLRVPLIGFSGAPFTLASYMIEGGPSRNYLQTKKMMVGAPHLWFALMDKLADMTVTYLRAQVNAGAAAVQLFDSWVGSLAPADFQEYVAPTMKKIFAALADLQVPLIYFGVGTGELLASMGETGATVIGVDWRVPLNEARLRTGRRFAVQGNLDPAILLAPWPEIERRAKSILDAGMAEPGFVFNLGHGVFPSVEVDTLRRLTEFVHEYSASQLAHSLSANAGHNR